MNNDPSKSGANRRQIKDSRVRQTIRRYNHIRNHGEVNDCVIGWGLIEEEYCIKYLIDEIWAAEDAIEASETEMRL